MKIGYSLSLMEIVAAEEVAYGDCAKFQITCPCCREAVFKKVRPFENGKETHFLSHYKAGDADAAECELRVAAMSDAFLARWSREGREQTLRRFLSVLRQQVLEGQERLGVMGALQLHREADRLLNRPDFRPFVQDCGQVIQYSLNMEDVRSTICRTMATIDLFKEKSEFWMRRQASYVQDVFSHLTTGQATQNLKFLAACGYVLAVRRPDIYPSPGKLFETKDAEKILHAMVNGKPLRSVEMIMRRIVSVRADKTQTLNRESLSILTGSTVDQQKRVACRSDLLAGVGSGSAPRLDSRRTDDYLKHIELLRMDVDTLKTKMMEAKRRRESLGAEIIHLEAAMLLVRPVVGLLAAVPFPDLAAARDPAVAV